MFIPLCGVVCVLSYIFDDGMVSAGCQQVTRFCLYVGCVCVRVCIFVGCV